MKSKLSTLGLVIILSALTFSGCGPATPQPTEIPTATPTQAAVEAPDPVRARDAALAYVSERYGEQAPALGLAWTEELTTPEGLVGSTTYQYTAEDWVVTVSYPIVRPDLTVYQVGVANDATGFHWEGQVDAAGRVTQAPEGVLAARDAALTYVIEHYGDQAPASGLSWMEENITPGWPDAPVPGWVEYEYTAEGWVVTVGHAVLPLEWIVYQITVSNQTTGFQWEGEVDASGRVTERLAPEEVRAARGAAQAYVLYNYGEETAPARGLTWTEERTTPEGLVGSETYEFTTGDWVVSISYPVVAPEAVIYQVKVANQTTGFWWEGEVDAAGEVTESSASREPTVDVSDPGRALDVALAYVAERYGEQAPAPGLTWTGDRPPPEEFVGSEIFEFTTEDWVATVSCGVVAPDILMWRVVVSNQITGFQWEGEVDAEGHVTERLAHTSGQAVVGWYGLVVSLPSEAQFDDYLSLAPEGTGEVGLSGANAGVEAEIEDLRDGGTRAHFWGTLARDVPDYGRYQLVVTRLRPDRQGTFFDPDPIEGWEGTVVSTPAMAQYDDYFVLSGDFAVRYGIDSTDPTFAAQLEQLRDTGTTIRVWGRLTCGIMDVNASRIDVIALQIVGAPPAPAPTSVDGWVGTIVKLEHGAQHDDYFEREDGQRFGIESTDEDMQKRIEGLRTVGARVRVWGQLFINVLDYDARQIIVERYELAPVTESVDGWVGTIVKLAHGSQYGEYFERSDGQRFGIDGLTHAVVGQIDGFRWTGAQVQVWGQLLLDVPAYEVRLINVERIQAVSGPAAEARNLSLFASASASSVFPSDRWGTYHALSVIDGMLSQPWVEGVVGPGLGEWILLTFPGMIEVERIGFDVGYDRDDDIFFANNRLKKATIIFSNGEQVELTFSDARGVQMIPLVRAPGPPIQTTFVKVVIEEVYPGSKYDDTCVGEIEVWGRTK